MSSTDEFTDYVDAFGQIGLLPNDDAQRGIPEDGFFSGPAVGERLPDFTLPAGSGEMITLHTDRGDAKAAVVFIRSAVW